MTSGKLQELLIFYRWTTNLHYQQHHYSGQNGITPLKAFNQFGYPIASLDKAFKMPKTKLPLEEGIILTHENCLIIYNDYEYIETFKFCLML